MKNLVSRAELARMGGVSEAHITQQCRPGRTFHPATVGDKVDVGHPILAEWLAKRQKIKASATKKKATKKKPKARYASPSTAAADAPSKEVEGLADSGTSKAPAEWGNLTLHEIAARFGGEPQFSGWLKSLNLIETIRERRLKNEEAEGSLISRDLVETHLLGLVEEQHQRLLTDLPKTVARTVRAHAQAEPPLPLEASEKEIHSVLGKLLEATKSKITRRLKKR